ncbi:MAG TPA: DUF4123 domain-containing protein [Bryobacteraceae bacterium]|nr:DUF4123 domain-containing protein [Bryobacteraceae bacterium]
MIVDAARDRRIFSMLLECHLEHSCLYSGSLHPSLEMVAPYLVQLDYDYRDTHQFIRHAWGNSWGIFLRSGTRMDALRRHLRRFLVVSDPNNRRMVFRYYDPRVLRVYLPTCTSKELQTVFGPIECFWMEHQTPDALLEFRLDRAQLVSRKHSIGFSMFG